MNTYCGSSHHLAASTSDTVRLKVLRIPGAPIWVESTNTSKLVAKPVVLRLRAKRYVSSMAGAVTPTTGAVVVHHGGQPR